MKSEKFVKTKLHRKYKNGLTKLVKLEIEKGIKETNEIKIEKWIKDINEIRIC